MFWYDIGANFCWFPRLKRIKYETLVAFSRLESSTPWLLDAMCGQCFAMCQPFQVTIHVHQKDLFQEVPLLHSLDQVQHSWVKKWCLVFCSFLIFDGRLSCSGGSLKRWWRNPKMRGWKMRMTLSGWNSPSLKKAFKNSDLCISNIQSSTFRSDIWGDEDPALWGPIELVELAVQIEDSLVLEHRKWSCGDFHCWCGFRMQLSQTQQHWNSAFFCH